MPQPGAEVGRGVSEVQGKFIDVRSLAWSAKADRQSRRSPPLRVEPHGWNFTEQVWSASAERRQHNTICELAQPLGPTSRGSVSPSNLNWNRESQVCCQMSHHRVRQFPAFDRTPKLLAMSGPIRMLSRVPGCEVKTSRVG